MITSNAEFSSLRLRVVVIYLPKSFIRIWCCYDIYTFPCKTTGPSCTFIITMMPCGRLGCERGRFTANSNLSFQCFCCATTEPDGEINNPANQGHVLITHAVSHDTHNLQSPAVPWHAAGHIIQVGVVKLCSTSSILLLFLFARECLSAAF